MEVRVKHCLAASWRPPIRDPDIEPPSWAWAQTRNGTCSLYWAPWDRATFSFHNSIFMRLHFPVRYAPQINKSACNPGPTRNVPYVQTNKQTSQNENTLDADVTSAGFSRRPVSTCLSTDLTCPLPFLLEPAAWRMALQTQCRRLPFEAWGPPGGMEERCPGTCPHHASRAASAHSSLWQGQGKGVIRRHMKCTDSELVLSPVEIESSRPLTRTGSVPKPPVGAWNHR